MQLDAAFVVVLKDFDRHIEVGRVVRPRLHAAELEPRSHAVQRLALLQGQQPRQLLRMIANCFASRMA